MTKRDRTIAVVLAHGKAQAAVLRHLPVWQENAKLVVFFTPEDDPLDLPGCTQFSMGKSDGYSAHTNNRCREALRFASWALMDYVLLIEYDSVVFGPIPEQFYPEPGEVTAPKFTVPPGERCPGRSIIFEGSQFLHFPILFSMSACERTVEEMDKMSSWAEGGLTDRYVGYAVERANLRVVDLWRSGIVYTKNIIGADMIDEAINAVRAGARWHHGIKDRDVFERMSAAARELPSMPS